VAELEKGVGGLCCEITKRVGGKVILRNENCQGQKIKEKQKGN